MIVKLAKERDGKTLTGTFGRFEVKLFENLSLQGNPMKIELEENFAKTRFEFTLDTASKKAQMKVSQNAKFLKMDAGLTLNGNNYGLDFMASTDENPKLIDFKIDIKYPLTWMVHVNWQDQADFQFDVSIADDMTNGQLSAQYKTDSRDMKVKLELVNNGDVKSANFNAQNNGKEFTLEAFSEPGLVRLTIKSPIKNLEDIKLEAEYTDNSLDMIFKYGPSESEEIEFEYENHDHEFKIEAEAFDSHHIHCKYNKQENSLSFSSEIAGKEMKIDAQYSGNKVTVDATEPFSNAGRIKFEGEWTKTSDGGKVNAKGEFNAINYQFYMVAEASALEIDIRRGTDQWKFEARAVDIDDGKKMTVEMVGQDMEKMSMEAKYAFGSSKVEGQLKATLPPFFANSEANVEVEYDLPNKLSLKAKATLEGEAILDVNTGANVAEDFSDVRITFTMLCPPLGLEKQDFGVELVYRTVNEKDFEYKIIVSTLEKSYKVGIKLNVDEDNFDSELLVEYGSVKFDVKLGGSRSSETSGSETVDVINAYINNVELVARYSVISEILKRFSLITIPFYFSFLIEFMMTHQLALPYKENEIMLQMEKTFCLICTNTPRLMMSFLLISNTL